MISVFLLMVSALAEESPRPTLRREAEGSQAPERIEPEGSIKSIYQLNGKPLEVDPD